MLFNKDSNGSAEMKGLIGFIYKSIKFENLITYIGFAERDIKRIIGKDVFDLAQDHYDSDNYQVTGGEGEDPPAHYAVLDELVNKIQLPVAIHAYRRYVPSNDVTHSDKGRQIFVSEDEKPAFEWMIDKDNQNLLDLAHEATDLLIEFLDEHIDDTYVPETEEGEDEPVETILIPWGASDEYLATRELFINTANEFDKVFNIGGSRRVFLLLVSFIRRIQETTIRACLTEEQYENLLDAVQNDDRTEEEEILLRMIREPLALLALSMAIRRLSVELLPDGLFTSVVTGVVRGKQSTGKMDRNEVSSYLEKDGQKQLARLQEYLRKLALEDEGETYEAIDPTERMDEDLLYVRL